MIEWQLPVGEKLVVSSGEVSRLQGELSSSLEGLQGERFSYQPCALDQLRLSEEERSHITEAMLPLFQHIKVLAGADYPM